MQIVGLLRNDRVHYSKQSRGSIENGRKLSFDDVSEVRRCRSFRVNIISVFLLFSDKAQKQPCRELDLRQLLRCAESTNVLCVLGVNIYHNVLPSGIIVVRARMYVVRPALPPIMYTMCAPGDKSPSNVLTRVQTRANVFFASGIIEFCGACVSGGIVII